MRAMRTAMVTVALAAAGCTAEPLQWPAPSTTATYLTPAEHLARASMALRGVRPSLADLRAVAADPGQLPAVIDGYLAAPEFGATIRDLHNELLLLHPELTAFTPSPFPPLADLPFIAMNRSIYDEPLRLVEDIVMTDQPYTRIVTADYTMADRTVATVWGLPPQRRRRLGAHGLDRRSRRRRHPREHGDLPALSLDRVQLQPRPRQRDLAEPAVSRLQLLRHPHRHQRRSLEPGDRRRCGGQQSVVRRLPPDDRSARQLLLRLRPGPVQRWRGPHLPGRPLPRRRCHGVVHHHEPSARLLRRCAGRPRRTRPRDRGRSAVRAVRRGATS